MSAAAPRIERIDAADGVQLALHRLPEPGSPRVLLVPGTFSNHTFWLGTRGTGFARALARAGFEPWVLDPRGHGASQRPRGDERWDFDDWAHHDVPAAIRAVVVSAATPPFLIGHSAGGAAILAGLAADPELAATVAGVVIVGTPVPWLQRWRGLAAHSIRALSRLLGRFPARSLGLGPEDEMAGVMEQWMTWNIEGHWRGDDGIDYGERLGLLRIPALIVAGSGDRTFAPPHACRALFDLLGGDDRTFLECGRSTGFSVDFDHPGLVVSRAAMHEIWPRIVAWLCARSLDDADTGS